MEASSSRSSLESGKGTEDTTLDGEAFVAIELSKLKDGANLGKSRDMDRLGDIPAE